MKVNQDRHWQSILVKIVKSHKEGDIIAHEEIDTEFGLQEPKLEECQEQNIPYRVALQKYQFQRMAMVEQLKNDLLICHKVYLDNVFGEGYRYVPACEQTEVAYKKATRNIHQEFEDGKMAMANLRDSALNADQRAKASDLQAKFALLESLFEKNRK